jgi:hypothetical protein
MLREQIMATHNNRNWRELFDVALFEPNRVKLRQRIENARHAINNRLAALMKDQSDSARTFSERIALRDALTTLAELYEIVYAPKPSASGSGQAGRDCRVNLEL